MFCQIREDLLAKDVVEGWLARRDAVEHLPPRPIMFLPVHNDHRPSRPGNPGLQTCRKRRQPKRGVRSFGEHPNTGEIPQDTIERPCVPVVWANASHLFGPSFSKSAMPSFAAT